MALIGLDGCFQQVNPALARLLGYADADLVGVDFRAVTHREDVAITESQRDALDAGVLSSLQVEKRYLHRAGHAVPVLMSAAVLRNEHGAPRAYIAQLQDLTEAKRADDERRLRGPSLQAIAENSPDIITRFDRELRHRYVNRAATRVTGRPAADFINQTHRDLGMPAHVVALWERHLRAVFDSAQDQVIEFSFPTPDGPRQFESRLVSERDGHGEVVSVLAVARDVTERSALAERLREHAQRDALTGLPNRVLFVERLQAALGQPSSATRPLAVLFVDLDHFKRINDAWGHHVGDQVLQSVAERLQTGVRTSDVAARMGGDEFAVLLDPVADVAAAEETGLRVLAAVNAAASVAQHAFVVGASIRIAMRVNETTTPAALLRQADAAMYRAKRAGRGVLARFDPLQDRVPSSG